MAPQQRRPGREQHTQADDDDRQLARDALDRDDPHPAADVADAAAVADGAVHVAEHARGQHGVEEHGPVAVGRPRWPAAAAARDRARRCTSAHALNDRGQQADSERGEHRTDPDGPSARRRTPARRAGRRARRGCRRPPTTLRTATGPSRRTSHEAGRVARARRRGRRRPAGHPPRRRRAGGAGRRPRGPSSSGCCSQAAAIQPRSHSSISSALLRRRAATGWTGPRSGRRAGRRPSSAAAPASGPSSRRPSHGPPLVGVEGGGELGVERLGRGEPDRAR